MVESIGSSPLSGSVSRIAASAATPAVRPSLQQTAQPSATPPASDIQLSGIAKALAASPPVDGDRVGEIKKAIANGSFPILPATIADRLIALQLNWDGHEAA